MASADDEMNEAMARLQEVRLSADEINREMADRSYTLMNKRRLFSVTVGVNGELKGLTFNGETYRTLAPAELSALIVETVGEARDLCVAEASDSLQQIWPGAGQEFDLLTSAASLDDLMAGFIKAAGAGLSEDDIAAFEKSWKADQ
jgi:DNA-binding protein YbaB